MRSFTTADLNKQIGEVTDAAQRAPVVITRRSKPRFVLMSLEHYEALRRPEYPRRAFTIDTMPDEFRDGLLQAAESYERERSDDD
ncbi:type II toxin-antitoxin system Phd/YefM family antitoxin [Methylorubrum sp. SB2]|uniref:type II toxin-antitoxin system Phd/YefM family antitoxin n=1 Tax=Methylorubrum subtropicum TaxID=3138812 RepID=UPI00313F0A47